MAVLVSPGRPGLIDFSLDLDDDGHRNYDVAFAIQVESDATGPFTALHATGMPLVGDVLDLSAWGITDYDPWAFLLPAAKLARWQPRDGEKNTYWRADLRWSTKPHKRCQDTTIENPLDEPQKVSGSFTTIQKELEKDRFGNYILSSSLERITGLTRDWGNPTVTVEQNVMSLGLNVFSQMIHTLNDSAMWGLSARCVKLSSASWERKYYGTCSYYYTRRFEFEIKYEGWDLTDVADRGFKAYDADTHGGAGANPLNYAVIKDDHGENTQTPLMLDGNGNINSDPINNPIFLPTIQVYSASNLFALGIPSSL